MMTRTLRVSILFICFLGIGLQSLRMGIVDLLATYDRPVFITTIRTIKTIRANRRKWRTNKKSFKTITKTTYMKKRTYPRPIDRMNMFYAHFLDLFSENDPEKRRYLKHEPYENGKFTSCYLKMYEIFMKHCDYVYYTLGGMRDIKALLARLCLAPWITFDRAVLVFKNTCQARFKFNAQNLTTQKQILAR